ncbi:hypothetical protein GJQ57_16770 [Ralstonia pickettii]|uniref:DUF6566 domain-containing protein n=1 Tax=Ralstonia pickettii TaxID=329 RepID=A0A7X2HPH4_RALPI|nr:DUF6566 family protein [Ralstonia pickettii]MRT00298.1 hypothetical protein [Ralstonia pickettii]WKZ87340.1 hypothetical protein N5B55_21545 [Ralstonia pickettii]
MMQNDTTHEGAARFECAGHTVTVSAEQDAQGVWVPRISVENGTRQFEIREISQTWRGWHTKGEAVRDGMEQARLLLTHGRS